MGFFDWLKNLLDGSQVKDAPQQPKKGYQRDSYYTDKAFEGTPFEKQVVTFEKRKALSYPSQNGLYVAEILLLEYCNYGTYPLPKTGYPGFWWFEYGIRDIEAALSSLEERGFIRYGTALESISGLTVSELKDILRKFGLVVSGKKDDLIDRICSNISEESLSPFIQERKYVLTDLGKQELSDNEYVPYMHKHPQKTIEDDTFGPIFNVWEINRRIGGGNPRHWKTIVHGIEQERNLHDMQRAAEKEALLQDAEVRNPKWAAKMRELDAHIAAQNDQLAQINQAEKMYKDDIVSLILFWEDLWKNGGLKFRGSKWHFRLPDLYIKQKRYDDALKILKRLQKTEYKEKALAYTERVQTLKEKATKSKK